MKKSAFIIAITAFSIAANAQDTSVTVTDTYSNDNTRNVSNSKTLIWSIGIVPSIPIGHFNDLSGFGLGGSLQAEYKPGNKVGITANAGYIDYFGKTVNGFDYPDFKYWPVLGGLKYYMSNNSYLHGQAGAGFGTNGLGTSFWYGAGLGFNLSKSIDAELKYTGWKQGNVTDDGTGGYGGNGGNGGGTGGGGTGGGYGGHYSTIDLRIGVNF
jgi:hypothetical protein